MKQFHSYKISSFHFRGLRLECCSVHFTVIRASSWHMIQLVSRITATITYIYWSTTSICRIVYRITSAWLWRPVSTVSGVMLVTGWWRCEMGSSTMCVLKRWYQSRVMLYCFHAACSSTLHAAYSYTAWSATVDWYFEGYVNLGWRGGSWRAKNFGHVILLKAGRGIKALNLIN